MEFEAESLCALPVLASTDAHGRDSRHGLAPTASQARAYVLLMTYKAAKCSSPEEKAKKQKP